MNKKLFAPILSIAALAAVSIGATYALFTDKKEAKVDITAGQVKVAMTSTIDFARSRYEDATQFDAVANAEGTEFDAVYENGNTAKIASASTGVAVTLDRLTPMDDISLKVNVTNNSNVNIKWRMGIELKGELIPALLVEFDEVDYSSDTEKTVYTPWSDVVESETTVLVDNKALYIAFPDHDDIDPAFDNLYQNKEGSVRIFVEAVQGNAVTEDPREEGYGFYNSYKVDGHWVHEITTAEEFRNIMDSVAHTSKSGQFDYPGAGDKDTVYLIKNDIDFGGSIYSVDQVAEVKAKTFTGILRGENVVLSNVHLTEAMGTKITNYEQAIWGLFDGVINASFENFTLSDFTIENNNSKGAALLATGQEEQNIAADGQTIIDTTAYLKVKNVDIDSNCSVVASGNAASYFALVRNLDDVSFENCTNSGSVSTTGTGCAGFIAQASYGVYKIDKENISFSGQFANRTMTILNCVNNGRISATQGYLSSFAGNQQYNATYTNYTNNGVIEYNSTSNDKAVGIAIGNYNGTPTIEYNNVINNGYILYGQKLPINSKENRYENFQVYYTNTAGSLVSGLGDASSPSEEYKNTKIIKNDIVNLSLSFEEGTNLLKVASNSLIDVAKITVSLQVATNTGNPDGVVARGNSTQNFPVFFEEISSISGTTDELNDRALKKVTQMGYFAPQGVEPQFGEDWGRIAKYCGDFLLDGALYGTTGYTDADMGYGTNSKGGYVMIRNISELGFTVLTRLHQDPHFIISAYDSTGKLVGVGDIYSGRIVGEHVPEDIHVTSGIEKYVAE